VGKLKTTERFVEEAIALHGDRYNYSKVTYVDSRLPVDIICKIHGIFSQIANTHLVGKGCKVCGKLLGMKKNTISEENVIKRFRKVHGNKYDYSNLGYINSRKNVTIKCSTHGDFKQSPDSHFTGQGCPKCGRVIAIEKTRMGLPEFIRRSNDVHDNKFDYSKVDYNGAYEKIKVICKIHGEFMQIASVHLNGCGCPKCANKPYEPSKKNKAILYCLKETKTGLIKIGVTKNTLKQRYQKRLKEFEIIGTLKMIETDAYKVEEYLLDKYYDYKVYNKNFANNGATEFLSVIPSLFKGVLNE